MTLSHLKDYLIGFTITSLALLVMHSQTQEPETPKALNVPTTTIRINDI